MELSGCLPVEGVVDKVVPIPGGVELEVVLRDGSRDYGVLPAAIVYTNKPLVGFEEVDTIFIWSYTYTDIVYILFVIVARDADNSSGPRQGTAGGASGQGCAGYALVFQHVPPAAFTALLFCAAILQSRQLFPPYQTAQGCDAYGGAGRHPSFEEPGSSSPGGKGGLPLGGAGRTAAAAVFAVLREDSLEPVEPWLYDVQARRGA